MKRRTKRKNKTQRQNVSLLIAPLRIGVATNIDVNQIFEQQETIFLVSNIESSQLAPV